MGGYMHWQAQIEELLQDASIGDDHRSTYLAQLYLKMLQTVDMPVFDQAMLDRYKLLEPRIVPQLSQFLDIVESIAERPDDDYYVRLYACLNVAIWAMANVWEKVLPEHDDGIAYLMARAMMIGIELGRRT